MIDTSDLADFTADLKALAADAEEQGKGIVAKGALNVKNDARQFAPSGPHTPAYPRSITYDTRTGSGWVEAEIGPRHGAAQWGLGNLLEYGGPHNPPNPHLEPALDHEEPRFYQQAEEMLGRLEAKHL